MKYISRLIISLFIFCFSCDILPANEPLMVATHNHKIEKEQSNMLPLKPNPDQSRFHAGLTTGVSRMGFELQTVDNLEELGFNEIRAGWGFGFHVGLLFNLNLTPKTSIRLVPSIVFGERFVEYYHTGAPGVVIIPTRQNFDVTLLQFPLHLKYNFVEVGKNTEIYAIGGMKYSYDLRSNEGMQSESEGMFIIVSQQDIGAEAGLGFERQLSRIKLSMEIKYAIGLKNIVLETEHHPRFYEAIDHLSSRAIMLSLIVK